VRDEDGIVAGGIERAPCAIGDTCLVQLEARLELERAGLKVLSFLSIFAYSSSRAFDDVGCLKDAVVPGDIAEL
jgi:hypothetical protein